MNSAQTVFDTGRNWDTLGTNSDRVFSLFSEKVSSSGIVLSESDRQRKSLTKGKRETEGGRKRGKERLVHFRVSLSLPVRDSVPVELYCHALMDV